MKRLLTALAFAVFSTAARAQLPALEGTVNLFTETPAAMADFLRENGVGQVFALDGVDPLNLPELSVRQWHDGGRMVYSGSPEYCPGPGLLYADAFAAGTPVRLYVYHVNASPRPLRFSVVLEPVGGPARIAVDDGLVIGPSRNYFYVGRLGAFIQLGRPTPPEPRLLDVTGPTLLDADLDGRVVMSGKPEPLIHSLHDFRVLEGQVRVSVVAAEAERPTLDQFPSLTLLGRDTNHDRGTYAFTNTHIAMDRPYRTTDGVVHLRIADGKRDPFAEGMDVTTERPGRYRGNYGVIYRARLKLESPDGRKVALVLNPRGGGVGGAVASWAPKRGRQAHYAPALSLGPIRDKNDATILARWDPRATPEVDVVWTPPGSASLPVEWLLIPYGE